MKQRIIFTLLATTISYSSLQAQSLWTSAEMEAKVAHGLNAFVEGEYRTHDGISATERLAGTMGLDYKVWTGLKLTAGYTYIHQRTEQEITEKQKYVIPPYWQPKHRLFAAATGSLKWNRVIFSLRERYQYTHRTEQYVPRFDTDGVTSIDDKWIDAKHKHILRSRLKVEYDIKNSKFAPFVSCELYNSLSDGFAVDKIRYTAGTDYKFNKKHAMSMFYRYIHKADDDDDDDNEGHVIGIGYKFKL